MKELNIFKIPILHVEEKICQDFNETVFVGEEHQQGPGNGLIIDDPYGELTDFAAREAGTGADYNKNDRTAQTSKGNNNLWTWDDLQMIKLKYAYVFKP